MESDPAAGSSRKFFSLKKVKSFLEIDPITPVADPIIGNRIKRNRLSF